MRVLFVIRAVANFHYLSSIVGAFCRRGHKVHCLFDKKWSKQAPLVPLDDFIKKFGNLSYELVESRTDRWLWLISWSREFLSYCRYLGMSGQSDWARRAYAHYLPQSIRPYLVDRGSVGNRILSLGAPFFTRLFSGVERITPADKKIAARLKENRPEVLIASPTNQRYSSADTEYLKAAKTLGIPTVVPVLSWDNLSCRGALYIIPDRLLAWNRAHAEQAQEIHGVSSKNIRIIGSPFFDGWFKDLTPSLSREEFYDRAGIARDRPYILWLGSSKNIARDESWLIKEVKDEFERSPDERMKSMQIVLRPHPANYRQYAELKRDGIVIYPKEGEILKDESARQIFYNSLHYAVGAVNINTSGIIDAMLAGKPSIALVPEEYRDTHEGTAHFQDLVRYRPLAFCRTPFECAAEIKKMIDGRDEYKAAREAFIKDFIRPRGLDMPAGEIAAQEIEEFVASATRRGLKAL